MKIITPLLGLSLVFAVSGCQSSAKKGHGTSQNSNPASFSDTTSESQYLKGSHQWSFTGKKTGMGSLSLDRRYFVFQSERDPKNPFDQIYVTDLASTKTWRVSTGSGGAHQASLHPQTNKVIFASNHSDPKIKQRMKELIELRQSGKAPRYDSQFDEWTEVYESNLYGKKLKNLTRSVGYDSEASYSPDGQWIVFASNRHSYTPKMNAQALALANKNAMSAVDIYIMKSDGSQVRRLTQTPGYDGGPSFSPDGQHIVWYHFPENSHSSELFTMKVDGSDVRQLTKSGAMAVAPTYHPSGDYIVYGSSLQGYRNFELYAVPTQGNHEPLRITHTSGLDSLPQFSSDGSQIFWTRKLADGKSQIFSAKWQDQTVRAQLKLKPDTLTPTYAHVSPEIKKQDVQKWIEYLASEKMQGRYTGSPEETIYTDFIARQFQKMGLRPYGTNKTYFQEFEFVSEVQLGEHNYFKVSKSATTPKTELGINWTPLTFSKSGTLRPKPVVFAGYGIVAPEDGQHPGYDSYVGLDVQDKWVMIFRYLPENISVERRQQLLLYSNLRAKIITAKNKGAIGVIFVSGPNSQVKEQLIHFNKRSVSAAATLHALSITDDLAQNLLGSDKNLKALQTTLDSGKTETGFEIVGMLVGAHTTISSKTSKGRNVLAYLPVAGAKTTLAIGAHGDHLGVGKNASSLMTDKDTTAIHFGADDNGSGVSGVMELAHYYSHLKQTGKLQLKQNVLFAVWSGEEIGVLGSTHFTKFNSLNNKPRRGNLNRTFSAYLNMDMIGRLRQSVSVQGIGSSSEWPSVIEAIAVRNEMPMIAQEDPYLPTDAMPFYLAQVPVLSLFTGVHSEYHTPRDTAEKINWQGTEEIIHLARQFVDQLGQSTWGPKYQQIDQKHNKSSRNRGFRVSLGTIPDYSHSEVKGVLLSGVVKGGSAEKAGVRSGDVIVKLGGVTIESIYDYVYSLQSIKPNKKTKIVVLRDGQKAEFDIVPQSKE
ncbi:MAG: M28 family peptidase [Bdellovibrionales bacterium]|nr:M28 family peptidase [Bdellovibrionales bacterium]